MRRLITLLLILPALAFSQSRFGHGALTVSQMMPIINGAIADSSRWTAGSTTNRIKPRDGKSLEADSIKAAYLNVTGNTQLDGNLTMNTIATEQVKLGTGSDAAPELSSGGDTNTGIRFPGSDVTTLIQGGTAALKLYANGRGSIGRHIDTTGVFSIDAVTDEPLIGLQNGGRNYIEFAQGSRVAKTNMGMLGSGELNTSFNMDYRGGVHNYYDPTKNAIWTALQNGGFAIQFAPPGLSGDIWSAAGALCLAKIDTLGGVDYEKIDFNISGPGDTIKHDAGTNNFMKWVNGNKYLFDAPLGIGGDGTHGYLDIASKNSAQLYTYGDADGAPGDSIGLIVLADGKTGIGVVPTVNLQIKSPKLSTQTTIYVEDPDNSTGMTDLATGKTFLKIVPAGSSSGGVVLYGLSGSGAMTGFMLEGINGGTPSVPVVRVRGGKRDGTVAMNITSTEPLVGYELHDGTRVATMLGSGYLGIGTATPAAMFHANNSNVLSKPLFRLGRDKNATPDSVNFMVTGMGKVSIGPNIATAGMTPADTLNLVNILGKKSTDSLLVVHNDIVGLDSVWAILPNGNVGNNGMVTIKRTVSLADQAEYTPQIPAGMCGWGTVQIGDETEWARFRFKADGTVTLEANSTNVGTTNDVDAKLNIYDAGTSGIVIENQLGSTLTAAMVIECYLP